MQLDDFESAILFVQRRYLVHTTAIKSNTIVAKKYTTPRTSESAGLVSTDQSRNGNGTLSSMRYRNFEAHNTNF